MLSKVIRACIAMQYPPRFVTDMSGTNRPNSSATGPDILEEVPEDSIQDLSRYDLVHFDLDPQNGEPVKSSADCVACAGHGYSSCS